MGLLARLELKFPPPPVLNRERKECQFHAIIAFPRLCRRRRPLSRSGGQHEAAAVLRLSIITHAIGGTAADF